LRRPTGIVPTGTPATFTDADRAVIFMGFLMTINTNISTRINELRNQLNSIQSIEDLTNSLSTDRV
jgi:hypothetical protein